uniref:Uncharacterized protein n=1 Tax=Micrurus spixii TaxID=129469 RepID=A0A2D4NA13_9SAUR
MARAQREQKELLALMHQQLVQMGYNRAAEVLLEQSGQTSFPSTHISLKEIITQWKKAFSQLPKQKRGTLAKLRIPDPKSSSESSEEEEAAQMIQTHLGLNNSTSSDNEDETDLTPCKLPATSTPKATPAAQSVCTMKPQPSKGLHQKAQQSEDSSEDSSDDSDSEEDRVAAQKPAQVTHKPGTNHVKSVTAKNAGLASSKPQPAGKGGTTSIKAGTVPVLKASESSSSDSSDSKEAEKPAKQPPIHPFFKLVAGKAASPSGKLVQTNLNTPSAASTKPQRSATKASGKEEQIPSPKVKPSQGNGG